MQQAIVEQLLKQAATAAQLPENQFKFDQEFFYNIIELTADRDFQRKISREQAYALLICLIRLGKAQPNNPAVNYITPAKNLLALIFKGGSHHSDWSANPNQNQNEEVNEKFLYELFENKTTSELAIDTLHEHPEYMDSNSKIGEALGNRCLNDTEFANQFLNTTPDSPGYKPTTIEIVKRIGLKNLKILYLEFEKKYQKGQLANFFNKTTQCLSVHLMRAMHYSVKHKNTIQALKAEETSYISYSAEQYINRPYDKDAKAIDTRPSNSGDLYNFTSSLVNSTMSLENTQINVIAHLYSQMQDYTYSFFSWKSIESKVMADELYAFMKPLVEKNGGDLTNAELTGKDALSLYNMLHGYMQNPQNKDKTLYGKLNPIYNHLKSIVPEAIYSAYCARKDEGYYIARIERILAGYEASGWWNLAQKSNATADLIYNIKCILNPDRLVTRKKFALKYIDTGKSISANPTTTPEVMPFEEKDSRGAQLKRILYVYDKTYGGEYAESLAVTRNRLAGSSSEISPDAINNKDKRFYNAITPLLDELRQDEKITDAQISNDALLNSDDSPIFNEIYKGYGCY